LDILGNHQRSAMRQVKKRSLNSAFIRWVGVWVESSAIRVNVLNTFQDLWEPSHWDIIAPVPTKKGGVLQVVGGGGGIDRESERR